MGNKEMGDEDKLRDLSTRIGAAKASHLPKGKDEGRDGTRQGMALGLRAGLEMLVTLLVGFAIGYFLDSYFGTRPFLMILFGFLGMGAGISNIYRLFNNLDMSVGFRRDDEKDL